MRTLLRYHQEGINLVDILSEGDIIINNGMYFADCDFFTKGKEYKIKIITPTMLKVTTNMSFMSINIFPQGLNAFTIKGDDL